MLAPAKVNLCLHVGSPDARGYHPLHSLVAFADIGDEVRLIEGEGPLLRVGGPFAEGLSTGEDNLILKAVRRFEAHTGKAVTHRIHLTKALPVASGLGGGSADAGAVLRALRRFYTPDMADETLEAIAATTGADGVMCLWSQPAVAEGYGERLRFVELPSLSCVLINPLTPSPTAEVYAAYDRQGQFPAFEPLFTPDKAHDAATLIDFLKTARNDLEAPAVALNPVIAEVLAALRAQPQTLMARLSGSGATCFALCDTPDAAEALAKAMQSVSPKAWVKTVKLQGSRTPAP